MFIGFERWLLKSGAQAITELKDTFSALTCQVILLTSQGGVWALPWLSGMKPSFRLPFQLMQLTTPLAGPLALMSRPWESCRRLIGIVLHKCIGFQDQPTQMKRLEPQTLLELDIRSYLAVVCKQFVLDIFRRAALKCTFNDCMFQASHHGNLIRWILFLGSIRYWQDWFRWFSWGILVSAWSSIPRLAGKMYSHTS